MSVKKQTLHEREQFRITTTATALHTFPKHSGVPVSIVARYNGTGTCIVKVQHSNKGDFTDVADTTSGATAALVDGGQGRAVCTPLGTAWRITGTSTGGSGIAIVDIDREMSEFDGHDSRTL